MVRLLAVEGTGGWGGRVVDVKSAVKAVWTVVRSVDVMLFASNKED